MKPFHANIIQISGNKNSGKTRLCSYILRNLTQNGIRAGSLKHSSHTHPIDKPGSDSDAMSKAGAIPSVFATQDGLGAFYSLHHTEHHRLLAEIYKECDIVIVESHDGDYGPTIHVLNESDGEYITPHLTANRIVAVVNDSGIHTRYRAFQREDENLIDYIISLLKRPMV